jgi:hypothetical protein
MFEHYFFYIKTVHVGTQATYQVSKKTQERKLEE